MANTNATIPTSLMLIGLSKEVELTRNRMEETKRLESIARSEACSALNAYNNARKKFHMMSQDFLGKEPI